MAVRLVLAGTSAHALDCEPLPVALPRAVTAALRGAARTDLGFGSQLQFDLTPEQAVTLAEALDALAGRLADSGGPPAVTRALWRDAERVLAASRAETLF